MTDEPDLADTDVVPVRHALLERAWRAHPEHERLVELKQEQLPDGMPAWQTSTRDDPGDPNRLEWIFYPVDLHDGREPISIFRIRKSELQRLERDQAARWTEHDA